MPHPVYGKPKHELKTLEVNLELPGRSNGYQTSMVIRGRASTQRADLWVIREQWRPEDNERGLAASDALAHVILTALQDRPDSQSGVERSLIGEGWEDVPLPF
uniref:Uncharacterized protein n=1 Tax=uncultured prokaryote TaxID=198431 RepID=A0A0H5Q1E0_9ZZZZ|nr:hypothetical protein [uncultured prokaryote]